MRSIPHLAAILCCAPPLLCAAPPARTGDFTEALEQAKTSGHDIVVLQRGSDWNRLGETLYQNVWSSQEMPGFTASSS